MAGGGLLLGIGPVQAEDIPLPTYYASPRGEYEEMRVYDNALLALVGGQVGINTGGGVIRAMLDVHGEAAAQAVGLVTNAGSSSQTWWLGGLYGADDFIVEGWDTIRGNYMPGTVPPRLGGTSHASVTITHADGHVGVGDFSQLPLPGGGFGQKSPANRLDIKGAAVVGAAYAGQVAAPANGLMVEGKTGVSLAPGKKPKNRLDVGGSAVVGTGYVDTATPPANGLLVEGPTGVGVASGTTLANKLEVGGPAVFGPTSAGTVDLSTVAAPFAEVSLGIDRQARTTKAVKAPADGYPKAWMGQGGIGGDWAFGVLDAGGTAGAITDGTKSELQVCAGNCIGLGAGSSTNIFVASSTGTVSITGSDTSVDTLELTTGTKVAEIKPGASLIIPNGAANNHVLAATTTAGKAVWLAPTTPGLQGTGGTTPTATTAPRPYQSLLFFGSCAPSATRLGTVTLLVADGGSLVGCVGTQ